MCFLLSIIFSEKAPVPSEILCHPVAIFIAN